MFTLPSNQVGEKPDFKDMIYALKPKAKIPGRRIRKGLAAGISIMLREEHMRITTDGWTSCANDSYHSLTVAFISKQWELVALPLSCTKFEGSTTYEDLAHAIESMVIHHGLIGRVMVCTTDCGPSMVKAGRLFRTARFVCSWAAVILDLRGSSMGLE